MLFTFFLARLCYEICPVRWSGNHLIKQGKYSASPNSLVAMVPFCKYLPTSVSLLDFAKHCRHLHTDTSRGGGGGGTQQMFIRWPVSHDRTVGSVVDPSRSSIFWSYPLTNYRCVKWSQAQVYFFPMIHIKYVVFLSLWPRTIRILISNWPRTRNFSQSFLKYRQRKTFSYHGHALRPVFMLWLVKIYFIYFLFYFIILPHKMNYKQNKNDNK